LQTLKLLSFALAMPVTLASTTIAQSLPPVRQLGRIITKSPAVMGGIASTRELPHGRVLVNDTATRRLYLFDSTLRARMAVLDSTEGVKHSYGISPGGVIAYRADSTLFASPSLASMILLDPAGRATPLVLGPTPVEMLFIAGGPFGNPGFDSRGRLVYRGSARDLTATRSPETRSPYPEKDSAPILGLNLITGKMDTITLFRIPKELVTITEGEPGTFTTTVRKDPLPTIDD
jgi:hypothetical protein